MKNEMVFMKKGMTASITIIITIVVLVVLALALITMTSKNIKNLDENTKETTDGVYKNINDITNEIETSDFRKQIITNQKIKHAVI